MKRTLFVSLIILALCIILPASVNAQVIVPANKAWTKTGIIVANGDQVTAAVTGSITLDPNVTTTADGMKVVSGPAQKLINAYDRGALLGRVGKKGVPFLIGANGRVTVAGAGELYFGINDDKVKNNTGAYAVTVSVNGKAK